MISVFLSFVLLMGAATVPPQVDCHSDDVKSDSVAARVRTRRICADLCLVGLGGPPCGDSCWELLPSESPSGFRRERNATAAKAPRRDACPLLCANDLGFPFCGCKPSFTVVEPNWSKICRHYCINYDHELYGCGECYSGVVKSPTHRHKMATERLIDRLKDAVVNLMAGIKQQQQPENSVKTTESRLPEALIDKIKQQKSHDGNGNDEWWTQFCEEQCKIGNGGAACNCDILPLSSQTQ